MHLFICLFISLIYLQYKCMSDIDCMQHNADGIARRTGSGYSFMTIGLWETPEVIKFIFLHGKLETTAIKQHKLHDN